jgi:hypothetical protein
LLKSNNFNGIIEYTDKKETKIEKVTYPSDESPTGSLYDLSRGDIYTPEFSIIDGHASIGKWNIAGQFYSNFTGYDSSKLGTFNSCTTLKPGGGVALAI